MCLSEWVRDYLAGNVAEFSRRSGHCYPVAYKYVFGAACSYRTAKALSELTGGLVSIDELCDPPAPVQVRSPDAPPPRRGPTAARSAKATRPVAGRAKRKRAAA